MSEGSLKILCFNATSIRGKLHEFNYHFDCYSPDAEYDVVSLTETWLNASVYDEEILFNSKYNIFRRDRDNAVSKKKDGGGVLLAVNSKFLSKRRQDLETDIEIIWIECKTGNSRSVFIGTVYLPPKSAVSVLSSFEDSLDRVCNAAGSDDSIVILGDFNMSDASWKLNDDEGYAFCDNHSEVCHSTSYFLDTVGSNELRQHNALPTCNNKPLDLVFTNGLPVSVMYATNPVSSTHNALAVRIAIQCHSKGKSVSRTTYNFKKADFNVIRRLLACLCWSQLLSLVSANNALSIFYDIIFAVLSDGVPLVKIKNCKFPYW
ncbi:MAG: endonuclease/exonuclease/phosphatase family protein, partial [Pseudomonadota bacterium]